MKACLPLVSSCCRLSGWETMHDTGRMDITVDDEHRTPASGLDDARTIFRFHCSLLVVREPQAGQDGIPLNPGPSTKQ